MEAIPFLLIFLSSFFPFINKGTWDSVYEIRKYHYCARVVVKLYIDISVLWFCLDILIRGNDI